METTETQLMFSAPRVAWWRMRSALRGVIVVLVAVAGFAPRARGAEDEAGQELSRRRYATAQLLYAQGRWAEAMAEFEAAKAAFDRPEFDYNIATCLQKLGRPAAAAEAFMRFLQARPADAEADRIRENI